MLQTGSPDIARGADKLDPILGRPGGIADDLQRLTKRGGVAQAHPQHQRRIVEPPQLLEQLVRQPGQRLPLERLAEAGHQLVAVPLSRRVFQQRRAADEIVLPPPGRQAAHEPLKNVPLDHRLLVERRGAKQLQHGGSVIFAMPLKHQPALHRDERVIDISGAAEQSGSQAKRLVAREANRRAGNLRAHFGVPLALGQAANCVEKTGG